MIESALLLPILNRDMSSLNTSKPPVKKQHGMFPHHFYISNKLYCNVTSLITIKKQQAKYANDTFNPPSGVYQECTGDVCKDLKLKSISKIAIVCCDGKSYAMAYVSYNKLDDTFQLTTGPKSLL